MNHIFVLFPYKFRAFYLGLILFLVALEHLHALFFTSVYSSQKNQQHIFKYYVDWHETLIIIVEKKQILTKNATDSLVNVIHQKSFLHDFVLV